MAILSTGPQTGSWRWWRSHWRLALQLDIGACCVVGMRRMFYRTAVECRWCARILGYRELEELVAVALATGELVARRWLTKAQLAEMRRVGYFRA